MKINLSHGNGGIETAELIENIFRKHFRTKDMVQEEDAAILPFSGKQLAFTTDSFVVKPLFFPGGDIGRLAVCGTVNDLLTTGSKPLYLSTSFILEENLDTGVIDAVAKSMREAADEAAVQIATGDTKVIEGNGGMYVNTTGIGAFASRGITLSEIRIGDAILVSGHLGDHHACILSQRMGIRNKIRSDVAPLVEMVNALVNSGIPIHGMRDVTRGGLATVLNEAAETAGLLAELNDNALPVSDEVGGLCQILGLDPLYMGNEGKMVIIVPHEFAQKALRTVKASRYGGNAAIIGRFQEGRGLVLNTRLGGKRKLSPLSGEGLPRIC